MKKYTEFDFQWATDRAIERISAINKKFYDYNFDPNKKERIKISLCKPCFYSSSISGQAMTEWECGLCGKKELNSNTDIPEICLDCSIEYDLCSHCGADVFLRVRRKKEIPFK